MEDTLERCTTQTKDWSNLPSIPWIKLGNKEWKWVEPSSFFDVLPEVLDAWSIMLYDQHHFFAPNALERFSLGTKSKQLHYEADARSSSMCRATGRARTACRTGCRRRVVSSRSISAPIGRSPRSRKGTGPRPPGAGLASPRPKGERNGRRLVRDLPQIVGSAARSP
jgi:Protein of unknown function (DUF1214)